MAKKVTLQDIATEVGMSKATISMILSGSGTHRFNEETVKTVTEVANRLGYKALHTKLPTRSVSVRKGHFSNKVMVLVPTLYNPYYINLVQGIDNIARKNDYVTSIHTTYWEPERETYFLKLAEESGAAGLIYAKQPRLLDQVYELNKKIPVIAIGEKRAELNLATVDMNNFAAAQAVAAHLYNYGHRKVAFISTAFAPDDSKVKAKGRRYTGVQAFFQEKGEDVLLYAENLDSYHSSAHMNVEYDSGYNLAKKCLKEHPEVTALVAINDMVAYGVYDALTDSGLKLPQDMSLCSFDNIFSSALRVVGLTSVDNKLVQCGESAFKLLMREMESFQEDEGLSNFTHIEYKFELLQRSSSGPVRATAKLKL